MAVDDKRGTFLDEDGFEGQFPVGMRVLAVDDDPICLKLLETLLRKCQYQVTTTNQAIKALQMLRENKNHFDLVISDVNMPDIDGFKLLELVGLEMDLPVIMLSAHSDTKLVMKGVTHGACDYLLKPVRIEELKNIWQHVIRRKKTENKDHNRSSNQEKARNGATGEIGQGATSSGGADKNGKLNRKRKDQNEDEEEEGDENGHENEDPATQKKPRVVWSVELHRKFVAAVNQLGFEKAVPKKILDLMDVQGLTRENVASHLQKYRLYLKRISNVASQQANMLAACGRKESSYLHMGSLEGFEGFCTLTGSGRFTTASVSTYPSSRMLGRLNSPVSLGLHGITSSGMVQPAHSQNFNHSANSHGKLESAGFPANQNASLFQVVPLSSEHSPSQQGNGSNPMGELSFIGNSSIFSTTSSFSGAMVTAGSSSTSMTGTPSNSFMLRCDEQHIQELHGHSSLMMPSSVSDAFDIGVSGSSNFLDHGKCNNSWQTAVQLPKLSSNSSPLSELLPPNDIRENSAWSNPHIQSILVDLSSSCPTSAAMESSRDIESQAGLVGDSVQNTNYTSMQRWEQQNENYNSHAYSAANLVSAANSMVGPLHRVDQNGQSSVGPSSVYQHGEIDRFTIEAKMRTNANGLLDQIMTQDGFTQKSYDSLNELTSAMVKRGHYGTMLTNGEL